MSEPEWYRQRGLACEFCGAPGHYIPIAPPTTVIASTSSMTAADFAPIEKRITCPEHRFLVRNRAERQQDERRFAERDHGRPSLNEEPWSEERLMRNVRTILLRVLATYLRRERTRRAG